MRLPEVRALRALFFFLLAALCLPAGQARALRVSLSAPSQQLPLFSLPRFHLELARPALLSAASPPPARREPVRTESSLASPAPGTGLPAAGAQAPRPEGPWKELEPGLGYAELEASGMRLVALRLDPARWDFVLCSAGRIGGEPRTLREWGEAEDLTAAINASMYLPDGLTSTGYMRDGDYLNNGRMVQRFGAFFAAGPDDPDLPGAVILDRDNDIWRELLPHYRLVIQNYRIINAERRILWSPGGPTYSISAVAVDGEGWVLFLHSLDPVEAYTFAQQLLHLPLDIRTVMYTEGGGQAGLYLRSAGLNLDFQGSRTLGFFVTGRVSVRLPNVLGARPRGQKAPAQGQNSGGSPSDPLPY